MKRWLTLCQKELLDYCISPLVFLFLGGFLVSSYQLFLATVFVNNEATFTSLFVWIPVLWIVFLPALTFESWSLDYKNKTLDLLKATPVSFTAIALAKFFAALCVMTLALLLTLPLILVFLNLGHFDFGVVLSSWIGAWLIGIFGISLGLFFARFLRVGAVSSMLTLLTLLFLTAIANPIVALKLPIWLRPWLEILSLDENFKPFLLGLITLKSICQLCGMSLILITLQSMRKVNFGTGLKALSLCILLILLNRQMPLSWAIDTTQNHQHTLSNATQTILNTLTDRVTVKIYFSKDIPYDAQKIETTLLDLLRTFKTKSPQDIFIELISTESAIDSEKARQLGLAAFQIDNKDVFMGVTIHYRDKMAVIPAATEPTTFEYQLALQLLKLQTANFPKMGVVLPAGAARAEFSTVLGLFEQLSDVLLIEQNQTNLEDLHLKALLVIDPQNAPASLTQEMDTLLYHNTSVLVFANPSLVSDSVKMQSKETGLEIYLQKNGITITPELLLDADQNAKAQFDLVTSQVLLDYPFWLKIYSPEFNTNHPVTASLNTLLLPWTHALLFNDQILKPENRDILVTTSPEAFLQEPNNFSISPQYVTQMQNLPRVEKYNIAAEIHLPNKPASLFVMSSSQFLKNNFLNPNYFWEAQPNSTFIANLIEHATWGDKLIGLRSKNRPLNPLTKISIQQQSQWHAILLAWAVLSPLSLWFGTAVTMHLKRKKTVKMQLAKHTV